MTEPVLIERPRPGVALITLNRPESLNALNEPLFVRLSEVLDRLDSDPEVKVIVLTGAGRGFCAGHDLSEVESTQGQDVGVRLLQIDHEVHCLLKLATINTPTIAAVNGGAYGGGLSMALACDMRIASEEAHFGAAFIKIGISSGDAGLSWTLPRLVGPGVAAELMLTGRVVAAREALDLRLVNRVTSAEDLRAETLDIASAIAAHDMIAIWMTKRTLKHSGASTLENALAMENTAQIVAMDSDSAKARIVDFLEARRSSRAALADADR